MSSTMCRLPHRQPQCIRYTGRIFRISSGGCDVLSAAAPSTGNGHCRAGSSPAMAVSGSGCGSVEPCRNGIPVDDVPPGCKVIGSLVLVGEVVGVLPDIDAQDRDSCPVHQRVCLLYTSDAA